MALWNKYSGFQGYNALQIFFWVLILVLLFGPLLLYHRYRTSTTTQPPEKVTVARQRSTPVHEIRGFRFSGSHQGRRVIAIRAYRLSIQRRKIGVFSIGLMNEARLQNAEIHLYGVRKKEGPAMTGGGAEGGPTAAQKSRPGGNQKLTFGDVFSKDALAGFPAKKITSIVMKPVLVTWHEGEAEMARISAGSAVIRFKSRDILFTRDVRVISGNRELTAGRLSVKPATVSLKVDGAYTLKSPAGVRQGKKLTTDLFLGAGDEARETKRNR